MLRDNLVGLIEPMPTPREKSGSSLALGIPKQRQVSDDRSSCLENPRPEGAESALTERLLLHFRLNQDSEAGDCPCPSWEGSEDRSRLIFDFR